MKSDANSDKIKSSTIYNELTFTKEQCETLFAAVLVHDDIYPDAILPDIIHLDYTQEQLERCYQICLQIWKDGVSRDTLRALIFKIYQQDSLSPIEQQAYKHMRAKFKHLRFAYITCSQQHRYPKVFHWLTKSMGKFQDAFKNKQHSSMKVSVNILRIMLSKLVYSLITKEINNFQASTPEGFRQYVSNEIGFIQTHLNKKEVTSKAFHEIRKVISRQVALYDNLKVLYPSQYHNDISHYISTINGMMGSMHDDLIVKKFEKSQDYYADTFEIPMEIKERLIAYTKKYSFP